MSSLSAKILTSVSDVAAEQWNAVVGENVPPVLRWEWLWALESSGSATVKTGWQPSHLTLWRGSELVALAPAYFKFHSMGEYVYDFGWANAAPNFGVQYYPKLLIGIPLSPITCQKIHWSSNEKKSEIQQRLTELACQVASANKASSVHFIFPTEEEATELETLGFFRRAGMQYHWNNPGYATYDDYLSRFDSKRRNQLKRERGAAQSQGVLLRTISGSELTEDHSALAFRFYEATCSKNGWGQLQLNAEFFKRAFSKLSTHMELVVAEKDGRVVAGAFNLLTAERRYGRYWGCFEEFPFLHFNVCLYHSIDACIRDGRKVFEPGAGGEHKISRGFQPTLIHSAHHIFDSNFEMAVRRHVLAEEKQVADIVAQAEEIAGMRAWKK